MQTVADLRAALARLDALGTHPLAAVHIQWAIELLDGEQAIDPIEED